MCTFFSCPLVPKADSGTGNAGCQHDRVAVYWKPPSVAGTDSNGTSGAMNSVRSANDAVTVPMILAVSEARSIPLIDRTM